MGSLGASEGADMDDENVIPNDPDLPIDPDLDPADPAEPSLTRRPRTSRRASNRAQADVLLAIALGGMLGASARYELAQAFPAHSGGFPRATFLANISGSFVLGALLVLLLERFPPTRYLRPFLATGVLGAYTTMSTYQVETALLLKDRHFAVAASYSLGSLIAGLAAAYLGIVIGRSTSARHWEART
jgi:CrcB protein